MIVEPARAKLNLALHVRRRRPDGYHDLETLFAFIADGDEIRLEPADAPHFTIAGPQAVALAGEGENLVTRAVARFDAAFGTAQPVAIELIKRLPVASGIGGGSADAAAALRALARLHGIALDDPRLFACADALGSDVPACLVGKTALGTGRGERLEPIEGAPGVPALLVNPGVGVPTGQVFARWDGQDRGGIGSGTLLDRARRGRNDLEAPARTVAPVIGEVLALLDRQRDVLLARMSGSGATCFALFADAAARADAARAIRTAEPGWWCLESALV